MLTPRDRARVRNQSGFSLMELLVAGSLLGLLTVGLSSSATITTELLSVHQSRAAQLIVVNALRARVIADARESTQVVCNGSEELVFNVRSGNGQGQGNLVSVTEYRIEAGRLIRWRTPPDRSSTLVDDAISVSCTELSGEGAELSLSFGDAEAPSLFYAMVAEKPSGGGL